MPIELKIFGYFHAVVGQSALLDWLIIFLGSYSVYFLVLGFILLIFFKKDWRSRLHYSSFTSLAIIVSMGLTKIIQFFFNRPRPFAVLNFNPLIGHEATAALPSGHAAFFFALAFSVFLISKKWGWVYLSAAILMGAARVAAGVHWPLDIAAGFLVAALSFFVVKWLLALRKS